MNDAPAPKQVSNPFGSVAVVAAAINPSALTTVEQQRAVAQVQAMMIMARSNPRNERKAMDLIIGDCQIPALAEEAAYQYARGGTDITGPSIRLAEAVARRWGNLSSGIKEIARGPGYSDCIAYAWDLETGYYDERQFQVRHIRDTRKGNYAITDERDIYELVANMGQRRKRAVLMAVIPGHVFDVALDQCTVTLKAKADLSPEGQKKLLEAFVPFGVSQLQIETKIQRRLEAITAAQVVGLKRIYASLRDGMSSPEDWFEKPQQEAATGATTTAATEEGPEDLPLTRDEKPDAKPATTSKAAQMRAKVKGAAEPAATQTPAPAPAVDEHLEMAKLRYADFQSGIEGASDPETITGLLDAAGKLMFKDQRMFSDEQLAKLKELADAQGG